MPSKNSKPVACRLPIEDYYRLRLLADKKGQTVSEWLTKIIRRALYPGKKMKG